MGNRTPLKADELTSYGPNKGLYNTGNKHRYYCPIHRGDNSRSFSLEIDSGRFKYFNCQAWGFLEHKLKEWRDRQNSTKALATVKEPIKTSFPFNGSTIQEASVPMVTLKEPTISIDPQMEVFAKSFQSKLVGSPGERYLSERGIPMGLALGLGVGFAPSNLWPGRSSIFNRLSFPHTRPDGAIVSLYGRAIPNAGMTVEKSLKHDHIKGQKAVFNANAMLDPEILFVCEGAFDALSMIASGYSSSCAIFGIGNLRWSWVKSKKVVICFDADGAGREATATLYMNAARWGKEVLVLNGEVFQGHKDLNEILVAGKTIALPLLGSSSVPAFQFVTPEPQHLSKALSTLEPSKVQRVDFSKVKIPARKSRSLVKHLKPHDDDSI